MQLEIHQRAREGITLLDFGGKLALGPEALLLREYIRLLLADGIRSVILNLAKVSAIDGAGLGTLMNCARALGASGGRLVLVNVIPKQESSSKILQPNKERQRR